MSSTRWLEAPPLPPWRRFGAVAALPGGAAFFAGGSGSPDEAFAWIWSVPGEGWIPVASPRGGPCRALNPTATALPDGTVLVVGIGWRDRRGPSVLRYDPVADAWRVPAQPAVPRYGHAAAELLSGRVLISGGVSSGPRPLAHAEAYDPRRDSWETLPAPPGARALHHAVRCGRCVVLAGGEGETGIVEVFDEVRGTWAETSPPGALPRLVGRAGALALASAALPSIRAVSAAPGDRALLLLAAPADSERRGACEASVTFDPASQAWARPVYLRVPVDARATLTATTDGAVVLLASGLDGSPVQVWRPEPGWTRAPDPPCALWAHHAVALPAGWLLVVRPGRPTLLYGGPG